ncbi:MAG: DUF302 domain-containing protein [Pseudomonadota bacterium]
MRILTLITSFLFFASSATAADWIVKESPHSVEKTVAQLTAVIEKAGATVFATVDHAGGASKVGLELAPSTLVIFGNPKIGTPIMQNAIRAGLDLPIRVLVFEEDRQTKVGYLDPAALKARYAIDGADEPFKKMTGALNKLTDAAIK